MNIVLLNDKLTPIYMVDSYESFIWTDRYDESGDFEYYNFATMELLDTFKVGYYLANSETDHLMIIETIEIISDSENGDHLKIVGRSLESLLERRIVWNQTVLKTKLQNGVKKLLNENLISPKITDRKIENFEFIETDDETIININIEAQYTGDDLKTVIEDLCKSEKIGYKVFLEDKIFKLKLYSGTDRSDKQTKIPKVTFSFDYDNVINMDYREDHSVERNVALVAGEGEGTARKKVTIGTASGINRKELFVDARDISKSLDGGGELSDADYNKQLQQRGKEKLEESKTEKTFEGEVDAEGLFTYNRDFFLGDIVNFYDKYGNKRRVRVSEMIFNETTDGYSVYPSFTVMDEEEENK